MLNISICFTEFLSFSFCLIFIEFLITFAFLTSDVFWFFIFFEACLFPIFLLIICFGSKERRTYAGFMISIYTLVGSIGLFYTISYFESAFGTMDLFILRGKLSYLEQLMLW